MQVFLWKSLSSLYGSESFFRERIRTPDANFPKFLKTLAVFLPIGFGLLMLHILIFPVLAEAFLGPQSWVTYWLHVSTYVLTFGTYAMLLSYLGICGLRGYVAWKLRRRKKELSEKG